MSTSILQVKQLSKTFLSRPHLWSPKTRVKAVNQVSFDIMKNEAFGLVGKSGCGKTTIANLILRLIPPSNGSITFDGVDLTTLSQQQMQPFRKDLQIIFQQAKEVLDPKMTIDELVREPLKIYNIVPPSEFDNEVNRLLSLVGIAETEKMKYPTQLSGGQKQRIIIARAIATKAKLIVCDEPVSALDVSVQGQIINLLMELKKELNLSYLFISHDIKIIQHICNRIGYMEEGRLVKIETNEILNGNKKVPESIME
jgi:ABC-type oligopeptide transport system ATPase subunit